MGKLKNVTKYMLKNKYKNLIIMGLVVISYSLPYLMLMFGIYDYELNLLKVTHIFMRSLYTPLIFLFLLNLLTRKKLAYLSSLSFSFVYFFFILFFMIYYKYFSFIPHLNVVTEISYVPYIMKQVICQLITGQELVVIICALLSILLSLFLYGKYRLKKTTSLLAIFLILFLSFMQAKILSFMQGADLHKFFTTSPSHALVGYGFLPLLAYEVNQNLEKRNNEEEKVPFPGKVNIKNEKQVMPRLYGNNVIIIQVESLDEWVIDYKVEGHYIMPFLRDLKTKSLFFENFFSQHSGGGTTDAELSCLTSLLPLMSHSGLSTADYSMIHSLPKILRSKGYSSLAMHANTGSFFNRDFSFSKLGFDIFYDMDAYSGEAAGWDSKDKAFFQQSMEKILPIPQPFFLYMITMQSHGPFDNHSSVGNLTLDKEKNRLLKNYLFTMNEVDEAIENFIEELSAAGLLPNTLVIIYSDHQSGTKNCRVLGRESIPLLIYHPDLTPAVIRKVGSHLDIAPTIIDLLGIKEPKGWLGTSLLYNGKGIALFNTLDMIQRTDGTLIKKKSLEHENQLAYSASILDYY